MLLHAASTFWKCYNNIVVQVSNTDVDALAVAICSILKACRLWVQYGQGHTIYHIPANKITKRKLGTASPGLPFLHDLTRCDSVPSFYVIRKNSIGCVAYTASYIDCMNKTLLTPI